jgi:hypothetical protein
MAEKIEHEIEPWSIKDCNMGSNVFYYSNGEKVVIPPKVIDNRYYLNQDSGTWCLKDEFKNKK